MDDSRLNGIIFRSHSLEVMEPPDLLWRDFVEESRFRSAQSAILRVCDRSGGISPGDRWAHVAQLDWVSSGLRRRKFRFMCAIGVFGECAFIARGFGAWSRVALLPLSGSGARAVAACVAGPGGQAGPVLLHSRNPFCQGNARYVMGCWLLGQHLLQATGIVTSPT